MFKLDISGHIPIDEAVGALCSRWNPAAVSEQVEISEANGRITSSDIVSELNIPVHRSAECDGVAVRSSDFADSTPSTSNWTPGRDYETVDMGDDFSDNFDAVIPVEMAHISCNEISFQRGILTSEGACVVPMGRTVSAGDILARKGQLLSPLSLANLAMGGIDVVNVIKRPRIVFIPTGNELVPMGERPARGQVVDCNSIMVKGLLKDLGADVVTLPIVRDDPGALEQILEQSLESFDIVLINGGSSKGQEDFCPTLLEKDSSFFHHFVKIRPGRPVSLAVKRGKPVINVPGPTTAALFTVVWCVRELILKWYGLSEYPQPTLYAKMSEPLTLDNFPLAYGLFFHVYMNGTELRARHLDSVKSLAERFLDANAYAILPIGSAGFKEGDMLNVFPIGRWI